MKTWKKIVVMLCTGLIVACHDSNNTDEPVIETKPLLPKKELRGVWMATVWGLDWPRGDYNAETQKAKYIEYMNLFANNNINAVFVQVRGMADSYYESPYEPWSKYITGVAGKKPDYDVLRFMIDEAHKRGISFHAWLNPYRIATRAKKTDNFPDLDAKIPVALTRDYSNIRVYNPALPEVRQRINNIVKDLITKYDVDGVHLDDYFYPDLPADESLNDSGNRALVFSQFTSFFEEIKKAMETAKLPYLYLDGSTPMSMREKLVKEFQSGKCPFFLISLKAGGLGLNLTGANYVIHLDPWWNPAIEQQATDRAYRIGQKQDVTVYRLISQHTIEEKILRLHKTKRNLSDSLLEGSDISHALTQEELLELLQDNR